MTLPTPTQAAVTPSCHAPGDPDTRVGGHDHHAAARASAGIVAGLLALPRSVQIAGAAAVVIGALLALGVPLASLTPLLAIGGCLGMHLLMGHSMMHGGHGGHPEHPTETAQPTSQAQAPVREGD